MVRAAQTSDACPARAQDSASAQAAAAAAAPASARAQSQRRRAATPLAAGTAACATAATRIPTPPRSPPQRHPRRRRRTTRSGAPPPRTENRCRSRLNTLLLLPVSILRVARLGTCPSSSSRRIGPSAVPADTLATAAPTLRQTAAAPDWYYSQGHNGRAESLARQPFAANWEPILDEQVGCNGLAVSSLAHRPAPCHGGAHSLPLRRATARSRCGVRRTLTFVIRVSRAFFLGGSCVCQAAANGVDRPLKEFG